MRTLLLLPLLVLLGCDSGDLAERTYPFPGAHAAVPIEAMIAVDEGVYNTEGIVASVSECPPDADCLLPDSFMLGQHAFDDPPQIGIRVFANRPTQLQAGARYRMSIEATGSVEARTYELRGYERLD
ncbi:MAG: hypothetical protein R3181_07735 [Rubricoccaceae bacterium]|nr:hypothetical protein [Rubricoccaceae bacterium]